MNFYLRGESNLKMHLKLTSLLISIEGTLRSDLRTEELSLPKLELV